MLPSKSDISTDNSGHALFALVIFCYVFLTSISDAKPRPKIAPTPTPSCAPGTCSSANPMPLPAGATYKMERDDPNLTSGLQRLEIWPSAPKVDVQASPANPFMRRRRSKSLSNAHLFGVSCDCRIRFPMKNTVRFKHNSSAKGRKLLREPVLKLMDRCVHEAVEKIDVFGHCSGGDERNFRSIIDGCKQLNLANVNDGVQDYTVGSFRQARSTCEGSIQQSEPSVTLSTTCSHQARMNAAPPCDVTIDELASYFETFVHIPKKMSSMAEMMYI